MVGDVTGGQLMLIVVKLGSRVHDGGVRGLTAR